VSNPACQHPDFAATVDVNRLSDVGAFSADVRIECSACHEPFVFVGSLPTGLSPAEPMLSADGQELRAPIQPASWGRAGIARYPAFRVTST
jgi:hypothetical protein